MQWELLCMLVRCFILELLRRNEVHFSGWRIPFLILDENRKKGSYLVSYDVQAASSPTYVRYNTYAPFFTFYVVASEQPAEHKLTTLYAPAPGTFSPLSNRFVCGQTLCHLCFSVVWSVWSVGALPSSRRLVKDPDRSCPSSSIASIDTVHNNMIIIRWA